MDKLSILLWDDPKLSALSAKVDDNEFGPQLEEFGRQLVEMMDRHNGIGLAAPQVGVLKRIFVMKFPEHEGMPPIVVCNPVLELRGAAVQEQEGCLSLPNVYEDVTRAEDVSMEYRNTSGKSFVTLLSKYDARVAQHEFDPTAASRRSSKGFPIGLRRVSSHRSRRTTSGRKSGRCSPGGKPAERQKAQRLSG